MTKEMMGGIYALGIFCFFFIFIARFLSVMSLFLVTLLPGRTNPFTGTFRELGGGNWFIFNDLPIFILPLTSPIWLLPAKLFLGAKKGLGNV